MIQLIGSYYDGADSTTVAAELEVFEHEVTLRIAGTKRYLAIEDLRVDARLGNTPRAITWGSDDRFVTSDQTNTDMLMNKLPGKAKLAWVSWLEQRMFIAVLALTIAALSAGSFAIWGIPLMAETIAFAAPQSISAQLGKSTLATIDQILKPSNLSNQRQQVLTALFRQHGDIQDIEFRHAKYLGANALTLSATTVVITDQLVDLAKNDEELLAVYLHELGHARLLHVERSILHNSAWVVLLSVVLGDISAAGDLILTLPLVVGQAAYSRDFEREADHFAMEGLQSAGLQTGALADILERMETSQRTLAETDNSEDDNGTDGKPKPNGSRSTANKILEYLSTHPATQERVAYIRNAQQ